MNKFFAAELSDCVISDLVVKIRVVLQPSKKECVSSPVFATEERMVSIVFVLRTSMWARDPQRWESSCRTESRSQE